LPPATRLIANNVRRDASKLRNGIKIKKRSEPVVLPLELLQEPPLTIKFGDASAKLFIVLGDSNEPYVSSPYRASRILREVNRGVKGGDNLN
jgi:hypothetical protein